jgi:superfamily II DNA or RNA helicase
MDDEDWAPEIVSVGPKHKRAIQSAVESARLAVFDEAHFLACETIQAIFKASKKCRYMFGMTGTDWRDDGADLLLEAACGGRIFNMPASRLIELGYLVRPKIALVEVPPLDEACPANWNTVYSRYITHNDVRNQLIVEGSQKLVNMGRKVLILVRYLPHGQKLVDMLQGLPVFFVNGRVDGLTRQSVKEQFEKGELRCLVASSVFDIGVDIPSLDALVLAGGGKSTVRVLQRIGRVIRAHPGKSDAMVMDFIDNARYLDKHSATRIAVYETEPNFKVKFPRDFDRASLRRIKKLKAKIG